MSEWLGTGLVGVTTLVLFFVPGGLVASILGARSLSRFALAAPISFSIAGITAVGVQLIGLPFTPVAFLCATIVVAGIALLLRFVLRDRVNFGEFSGNEPLEPAAGGALLPRFALGAAIALPAAVIALRYTRGIGQPGNISQLFDNVFHVNAVKLIADTQNGSSLLLGNLTEASQAFYPAAMHDMIALVSMTGGFGVPESINVATVVIGALVWPLSCLFLVIRLFGNRVVPIVIAGVVSVGFGAFPYRLISFGVLYPLHAAMAMLPIAIALFIEAFRMSRTRRSSPGTAGLLLLVVLPAIALTHPSVIVAALLFSVPFCLARAIAMVRTAEGDGGARTIGLATLFGCGYLAVTAVIFFALRPPLVVAPWSAFESTTASIGAVITSSPLGFSTAYAMFALIVVGSATAFRRPGRYWPLLAVFAIAGLIYVAGASFADGWLRDLITGVWYRDNIRLASMLPVATLPLAVLGGTTIADSLRRLIGWSAHRRGRPLTKKVDARVLVACGLVVALAALPLTQRGQISSNEFFIADTFSAGPDARLLSDDERTLIEQVAGIVPEDEVVVGNPATGASMVYAIGDRAALAPHIFGGRTEQEQYLLDHWDEAGTDPQVCEFVQELDAYWALDFGTDAVLGNQSSMSGLDNLGAQPPVGIEERGAVGDARLYEATACRP